MEGHTKCKWSFQVHGKCLCGTHYFPNHFVFERLKCLVKDLLTQKESNILCVAEGCDQVDRDCLDWVRNSGL
jgi:hypothetical protein